MKAVFLFVFMTDMSVVVQQVVGELERVEGDSLLHPLGSTGRRVWVEVHPAWRCNVCSPCHQPGRAVERISITQIRSFDEACGQKGALLASR